MLGFFLPWGYLRSVPTAGTVVKAHMLAITKPLHSPGGLSGGPLRRFFTVLFLDLGQLLRWRLRLSCAPRPLGVSTAATCWVNGFPRAALLARVAARLIPTPRPHSMRRASCHAAATWVPGKHPRLCGLCRTAAGVAYRQLPITAPLRPSWRLVTGSWRPLDWPRACSGLPWQLLPIASQGIEPGWSNAFDGATITSFVHSSTRATLGAGHHPAYNRSH